MTKLWIGRKTALTAATFCTLMVAPQLWAATHTVSSLADSGVGSLREAIQEAAPGDTIQITAVGVLGLANGPLAVNKDLTIQGPGADYLRIDAAGQSRAFTIADVGTATVAISGLRIENGNADYGGAIFNGGVLSLTDVHVAGSSASVFGGAIANYGTLTFVRGGLVVNSATFRGGAIFTAAGSTLTILNSTVSGNRSYVGGAIDNNDGTVTIAGSTLSGNFVDGLGGGSGGAIHHGGLAGEVRIVGSTISHNTATSEGGGIYAGSGTLSITNSTVAFNASTCNAGDYCAGGGIFAMGLSTEIANSTLVGNVSLSGGNLTSLYGVTTVRNSILAKGATGLNCFSYTGGFVSADHNLSDDSSCIGALTAPGDRHGAPVGLDPAGLQSNGGPTMTVAVVSGSPAIDAVPEAACADTFGPLTADQRGVARPQGAACDVGAVERVTPPYQADVLQPINSDGSSVFKASRGVVPVKFSYSVYGVASCALPPATISLFRTLGPADLGAINESIYSGAADQGSDFRIDSGSCRYIYNLETASLGPGKYSALITVNGTVAGSATFTLR